MSSKNYIDYNEAFSYPLQWIEESEQARRDYQCMLYRTRLALQGKPWKNLYKEEITSNLNRIPENELSKEERTRCLCVPEGESFTLRKAVNNRAAQMSSGVDSYEYVINDPFMLIEEDTEDLLAAKCEQDYIENKLGSFAATFSKDITCYGVSAVLVKYCPDTDKNDIYRINPKNIWFDTMYSSTGRERFRGYSTMISWAKLKEIIENERDAINYEIEVPDRSTLNKNGELDKHIQMGKKKITDLNDLDIYVQDMNKLAISPSLQGGIKDYYEYDHDLRSCYNLNWYQSYATDAKQKTNNGYNGDDVELTVMYDLDRKIEFKIINRRFVISANAHSFRREIAFPIYNPITDETTYRVDEFCLDCPLKFQYETHEDRDAAPYPMAPIFALLDTHDRLCSWRAKREHVTKLLSILRIETNGADATSLRKTMNIMGVILDDIQGDINAINFAYSYEPIDSEITILENTIIEVLSAYTQFDALQSMGDRASAAESGMASGAIAQGLSVHQDAIMSLYGDIARQCIANRVIYSDRNEFPVINLGQYSEITIQQMALSAVINVKPKLAKKIQEKSLAANAITIASGFKDILTPEGLAYFIEQGLMGQVPRKLAATFIQKPQASAQEVANAQLQAQNQAEMLKQNREMYEQNPAAYETQNIMDNYSPEEIDQILGMVNQQGGMDPAIEQQAADIPTGIDDTGLLDMAQQDGAMAPGMEGMTAEMGSMMANPNQMV